MKILFCTPYPPFKEFGGAKVVVELAEAMTEIGCDCQLIGPPDLLNEAEQTLTGEAFRGQYAQRLRDYLQHHAAEYDVVDYDHVYLPFPRTDFPSQPLFVARSVLLAHYLETIPLPIEQTWRSRIRHWLKGRQERAINQRIVQQAQTTIQEADLVNVSNEHDKAELVKFGIPASKVLVLPYGLSQERLQTFTTFDPTPPPQPTVCFIGTFDARKGSTDFPGILEQIHRQVPQANFLLIGTRQEKAQIMATLPAKLADAVQVISQYSTDQLPQFLKTGSVGIFPSYYEGFPFGVLEMLAAAIPVVAYDSPGPSMMLPSNFLVPLADAQALAQRVVELLKDSIALAKSRQWAKARSTQFQWQPIAMQTQAKYVEYDRQRLLSRSP